MSFDADILPSIVFGVFISVALIAGLQMIRAEIRAVGGAENRITDLCFWLMVAAIAGARCGELVYRHATVFDDPFEILRLWNGGSFYYGGAAAALITGVVFIKHARLPLWKTADMFAPTLAIGHFFVWIGCFFSQLFSGTSSHSMIEAMLSWPEGGLSSVLAMPYPRFLYLASGSFIIFIILLILRGRKNFDGRAFWIFVTLHHTLQLIVNKLDFPGYGHPLPAILAAPQIISVFGTLIGLMMLLYLWHRSRQPQPQGSKRVLPQ